VFEGFDREGKLRAICGGGRYDRLLGTFGGEEQAMAGFGFGDAVIVELLKDKGLLPRWGGRWCREVVLGCAAVAAGRLAGRAGARPRARARADTPPPRPPRPPPAPCCPLRSPGHSVDDLVLAMEPALAPAAAGVATRLRGAGRRVDLALEGKRMKWVAAACRPAAGRARWLVGAALAGGLTALPA
jgi:histidyl-tRNA synthetase